MGRIAATALGCLLALSASARNPRGGVAAVSAQPTIVAFTYVPPTTNTNSTSITTGEVTGYQVGIRSGGTAGTYPTIVSVQLYATSQMLTAAILPRLAVGSYFAAVRAIGATNSAWSAESSFNITQ